MSHSHTAPGQAPDAIDFPEAVPFWNAAREGRLLIRRCTDCAQDYYYPRPLCPFCMGDRTEWKEAGGGGHLYSFTVAGQGRRRTALAVVELDEGPRLTAPVVDSDLGSLAIGQRVQVSFPPPADGGPPRPAFVTREAAEAMAYIARATERAAQTASTGATPPVRKAAVIGAGTMGTGIAMALANADIATVVVDASQEALERAVATIRKTYAGSVAKGSLAQAEADARIARITTSLRYQSIADADLIVEAVWEQMALKKSVFAELDRHARPGAILGTNTSALDIDEIAASTSRPEAVIGLHFFSPAHIMKLLEVVRGARTSDAVIQAAMAFGRQIGKVPVLVRVCDGFVGNRLLRARESQAQRLLLEGALPQQIDAVLEDFGFPMGSFRMLDMSAAIELNFRRRQATGEKNWLIDTLYGLGRYGLKAGRGWYRYEEGKRDPLPDPEVEALIEEASRQAGLTRRRIADDEVRDRLLLPMVNEALHLVAEGIVERAADIDVVWSHGYGWPRHKGGVLFWAESQGWRQVRDRLHAWSQAQEGWAAPPALLDRLAEDGASILRE